MATTTTLLLLGGTGEARALAAALADVGRVLVVSSLAGRVRDPALPVGAVRVGGFGGVAGLRAWLALHAPALVVDATHPFAEGISGNAAAACTADGVPVLRLQRPGWVERPGDAWLRVDSVAAAAQALPRKGSRPFLTTGRGGLEAFLTRPVTALVRCVDPPDVALPGGWHLLLQRGPYTLNGELALLREHAADVLVTKDSGGAMTVAKLDAARALGLPVLVVRRPPGPDVPTVATVTEAVSWVRAAAR